MFREIFYFTDRRFYIYITETYVSLNGDKLAILGEKGRVTDVEEKGQRIERKKEDKGMKGPKKEERG
jgi:hypothetical protein